MYLGYINNISNIWNIKKKPIFLSRRLEESEKKRQAMMQAMKEQASKKGPNFTITRKDLAVRIHNTGRNADPNTQIYAGQPLLMLLFRRI